MSMHSLQLQDRLRHECSALTEKLFYISNPALGGAFEASIPCLRSASSCVDVRVGCHCAHCRACLFFFLSFFFLLLSPHLKP